jgi:dolichyl-phosphate beta-glucosyltransferase
MEKKISIIIPCFNEEKRISKRFSEVYKFFKKNLTDFELILVNDGSTDRTEAVLKKLAKKNPKIEVISYEKNQGKGFAVKKGVESAHGGIIGFMDADFSIEVAQTLEFIELIESRADVVIGDRRLEKNKQKYLSWPRKFLGDFLASTNSFLLNIGEIKDSQCGFKFFKAKVAKNIFSELTVNRWLWDLEMILLAKEKGYRIVKKDVKWAHVAGSKVNVSKDSLPVFVDLFKIYLRFLSIRAFSVILVFLLLIIMTPFLINSNSLVGRNGDYRDFVRPDYFFIKQTILTYHQIPLWNPTVLSGVPEIANPQSPLLYLPNILALFLPIDLAVVLIIFFHVFMAGIVLFILCRRLLKWTPNASLITALGFSLSPFLWSKAAVGHLSMFFAQCLLVPALFFGVRFYQRGKIYDLLFLSVILSLSYLNYPTIYFYSVFFGLLAVFLVAVFEKNFKRFWQFLLASVLSIIFISPIFLIQLQATSLINRSSLTLTDVAIPVWSIRRFVTSVFLPSNIFKDPDSEVWLYPGLILMLSSVLGFIKLKFKWRIIFGFLGLLVLLVTLGTRTPVFGLFYKYLPEFKYFRVVTRDWFVFTALLAFLAGFAIEKIKKYKS